MAIIKFNEKDPIKVKLDYDEGKETDNQFEERKKQYMWSCNDGDVFYATPSLNTLINSIGAKRGKVLSIKKKRLEGKDIPVFEVDGETLDSLGKRIKEGSFDINAPLESTNFEDMIKEVDTRLTAMVNDLKVRIDKMSGAEVKEQPFNEDDLPF